MSKAKGAVMSAARKNLHWIQEYVDCVEKEIAAIFPHNPATTLERAVVDSIPSRGKRVRAILALLWCELFSDDFKAAVPAAVAYELAHASALVQDDVLDSSDMRRGEKSIVSKYGLPTAILASDLLLFHVPKLIAKYHALESNKLSKLFDLLGEACRASTWGEFMDMEIARRIDGEPSELEYEEMIRSKTSALLSAPCASGAIIGGASEEGIALACKFGELIGMAYQVQDDTLDLVGDELILGKPIFTDVRAGKKNLVLIHCFTHCSEQDRTFLASLVNRTGEYDVQEISKARKILETYGSVSYGLARSSQYVEQANNVLLSLPKDSKAKTRLLELSDYLTKRYN